MKPEKQNLAKDLYFNTDRTQQEIADILDVNRRTVYLWIKHGKWEEMKIAARQAPGMILQDIYNHITEINDTIRQRDPGDRCPTMQEVEKMRKLLGMTTNINKKHAGSYMEAFSELLVYLTHKDLDLAKKITLHADNFVRGNFGDESFHLKKDRSETVSRVLKNLANEPEINEIEPQPDAAATTTPAPDQQASAADAQDNNGIFCDKNAIISSPEQAPTDEAKPLPVAPVEETGNEKAASEYPISDFSENGKNDTPPIPNNIEDILKLPPEKRPSPFRDGNTLWVNHIDDADEYRDNFGRLWGERKIGDTIKRYPTT